MNIWTEPAAAGDNPPRRAGGALGAAHDPA